MSEHHEHHEHHHHDHHHHGGKAENEKEVWAKFGPVFNLMDSTSTTFYYTLIHMLSLPQAKHILEVGCGSGKLLHQAAFLKPQESTYLATDLSPVMLDLCRQNLTAHLTKMGVSDSFEDWTKKHHMEFKQADGAKPIESTHKFDRIIANLVIHHSEHPLDMMKNLAEMAEPGCLLGVTEFGREELNDLRKYLPEAYKAKGETGPKDYHHHHEHLYGKLEEMGVQSGWEALLIWEQNAPYTFTENCALMKQFTDFMSKGDPFISDFLLKRFNEQIQSKQAVGISCQLAIFRKK